MKKQTTEEIIRQIAEDYVKFGKYEEEIRKDERLLVLSDVEKIIDEYLNPNKQLFIKLSDLEKTKQEIAKIHSQKQAKQLQEGKFDIISQTAFELKCSPDNDPNANKGEGK